MTVQPSTNPETVGCPLRPARAGCSGTGRRVGGYLAIAIAVLGHALLILALLVLAIVTGFPLVAHLLSTAREPQPAAGRMVGARAPVEVPTAAPARVVTLETPPTVIVEPTPEATPTPPPIPTPLPLSAVDTGGRGARLRQEPSLEAAIVGVLPDRTHVAELGPEADEGGRVWRHVRSPDGREGWIDAGLLLPVATTPDPAGPAEPRIPPLAPATTQPVSVGATVR